MKLNYFRLFQLACKISLKIMSDNKRNNKSAWWQPALVISSQVTGFIAGPIIIALFLGKYLDKKYGTDPWIFLGLTGIAFIISCSGIISITLKYTKKIEQELREKKEENQSTDSKKQR